MGEIVACKKKERDWQHGDLTLLKEGGVACTGTKKTRRIAFQERALPSGKEELTIEKRDGREKGGDQLF